jgi:LPXTG-site transpeptidase (sortase) family protein
MIANLLQSLTITDWLAWGAGLALGVSIIFLIRSRQVWRYRRAYGYDVYTAESRSKKLLRWAGLVLAGVVVLAGVYIWQVIRPGSSATTSLLSPQGESDPLAGMTLTIPQLGIEASVIEASIVAQQWDVSRLTTEVAHLEGTVYPGEPGNAALAGHITIPGAGWGPFKDLGMLQSGDRVFIERGEETFIYEVIEQKTVDADAVEVVFPTQDTRLTLLTCTGWDIDLQHYSQRMVVVAQLIP